MAANLTKVLLYDLDEELANLIEDIIKFQGTYSTLYERLMDLNTDTFNSEIRAVIDDLINGYQNGGILTVGRIKKLEENNTSTDKRIKEIEESDTLIDGRIKKLEEKNESSEQPKFEGFTYDADKDIQLVSTYDKADSLTRLKLSETLYEYSTVNGSKEIVKSTTSIYKKDGITIAEKVIKEYSYDIENNVKSISTTVV